MKKKKSNKTASECRAELSGSGQRAKAERNLAVEKSKPVTEKKVWISSRKLFPNRVPILIEVPAITSKTDRDAIIIKRMNKSDNTTI